MNLDLLKKYPIACFCTIGVLLLGVIIFLRGGAVDALQLREEDLESRLDVIKNNLRYSNGLEADLEELREQTELLAGRIFNRNDLIQNSKFFYRFANADDFDVSVDRVTQGQNVPAIFDKKGPKELKLHSAIVYDLDIEGKFFDIVNFLQDLDQAEAVIRVSGFDVSHAEEGKRGIDADLRMRVQVFALAEKEDS
ncbi:MAG: hypothetical protein ACPGES_12745 [Coraliomargarita sp.]